MKCPHCKKDIEDRWIYPVGTRLFRRTLGDAFVNVTILEHCLSVEGWPVYGVEETYRLNKDDVGEPIMYMACTNELQTKCEVVKEPMVVISQKEYQALTERGMASIEQL